MNLIYTVYNKEIEIDLPCKIPIWFFGDVHRDTSSCDVDRWKRFLKEAAQDDAWFFGMGDYHDFVSISEKKKMQNANLHEETIDKFDMMTQENNRDFCKEIGFMRGRLLGLLEGNHHWINTNGQTSTEDLAGRMETPYLGWLCHYTITFKADRMAIPLHIVACHGKAGGKTYGISINQVADLKVPFPSSHVYVSGHDHQRWADPISVLVPKRQRNGEYKIKQQEQLLCRSGSFKKSYEPDKAGYEANRLLKPANLGALKIFVNIYRLGVDDRNLVMELSALV